MDFYRRTIMAATDGKLVITEYADIERITGKELISWEVNDPAYIREIRDEAAKFAGDAGLEESKIYHFKTAVGEAVTNALKHAGGGRASIHRMDEGIAFTVSDKGKGIEAVNIPLLALVKGFSTAGTLGMGFKVMISFARQGLPCHRAKGYGCGHRDEDRAQTQQCSCMYIDIENRA